MFAKKKNRVAEARQKDHSLQWCSTGKKGLEKFLLPSSTNTVGKSCLKLFSKRQNTKKKEVIFKEDESLCNQAQINIQLRIPSRSQWRWSHRSSTSCSSTAGKAEGFTPCRHLTAHPTSHCCCLCTTTSIRMATDWAGLFTKSKLKLANQ